MSTYWDVACLECDEYLDVHLNHGEGECRWLVESEEIFDLLASRLTDMPGTFEVKVWGERGYVDPSFFRKHRNHVLAPVSEYKDIGFLCNERERNPALGPYATTNRQCFMVEKHEGDHTFELVSGDPYKEWPERRKKALELIKAFYKEEFETPHSLEQEIILATKNVVSNKRSEDVVVAFVSTAATLMQIASNCTREDFVRLAGLTWDSYEESSRPQRSEGMKE